MLSRTGVFMWYSTLTQGEKSGHQYFSQATSKTAKGALCHAVPETCLSLSGFVGFFSPSSIPSGIHPDSIVPETNTFHKHNLQAPFSAPRLPNHFDVDV